MAKALEDYATHAVIKAAKGYFRVSGARLADLGLQPGQDVLLRQLWGHDGMTQSELAARLGVEPPTVTKALTRLQKDGLLTRRKDPSDARVWRVYLTARAKKLHEPMVKIWADLETGGLAGFSAEEEATLLALARRVRANFERMEEKAAAAR